MSRIVDLTVTIGPETLSPPSVNKRLTLTSNYRGPGFWRASSVDMVLHTGSHVDFSLHVQEGGEAPWLQRNASDNAFADFICTSGYIEDDEDGPSFCRRVLASKAAAE